MEKINPKFGLNNQATYESYLSFFRNDLQNLQGQRQAWIKDMEKLKSLIDMLLKDNSEVAEVKKQIDSVNEDLKKINLNIVQNNELIEEDKRRASLFKDQVDVILNKMNRIYQVFCPIDGATLSKQFTAKVVSKRIKNKYNPYAEHPANIRSSQSSKSAIRDQSDHKYDEEEEKRTRDEEDQLINKLDLSMNVPHTLKNQLQNNIKHLENELSNALEELLRAKNQADYFKKNVKQKYQEMNKTHIVSLKQIIENSLMKNSKEAEYQSQNEKLRQQNVALEQTINSRQTKNKAKAKNALKQISDKTEDYLIRINREATEKQNQFNHIKQQYETLQRIFTLKFNQQEEEHQLAQARFAKEAQELQNQIFNLANQVDSSGKSNVISSKTMAQKLDQANRSKLSRLQQQRLLINKEHQKCIQEFKQNNKFYQEHVYPLDHFYSKDRQGKRRPSKEKSKEKRRVQAEEDESLQMESLQEIKRQIQEVEEQLQKTKQQS